MVIVLINAPKFLEYEKVDADVRKDFDLEDKRWNDLLGNMNYWIRESFELTRGHLAFLQNHRNITETGVNSSKIEFCVGFGDIFFKSI